MKSGKLYIIKEGNGPAYKIGVTRGEAEKRRGQLQTGNSKPLSIIYLFQCNDPYGVEDELHDIFEGRKIHGGGDEFFEFDDLEQLHRQLNKMIADRKIVNLTDYIGEVESLPAKVWRLLTRVIAPSAIMLASTIALLYWIGII